MGLNDVVSAERVHIGFFGMRNAGKSSLVNAVTGQNLSVVSDVKGTTTDPVKKAMELLPLGPVVVIDTPGLDDEGELGELRIQKAKAVLSKIDVAVLVVDSTVQLQKIDYELIDYFCKRNLPYIIAYNKSDLLDSEFYKTNISDKTKLNEIYVSSKTGENIFELKEKIGKLVESSQHNRHIISDLLKENDVVVLVTPIDSSAPKGRLILPQQQTIRELLEKRCLVVVCQETEVKVVLENLKNVPKLVITDSQVFESVSRDVPDEIDLTSFSIIFARYKGNLKHLVDGARRIDDLKDDDLILISEGCTHHRQCNDIGTTKLPTWLENYTQKKFRYHFTSGTDFPENLTDYSLVVHCGGCMLNEKEMKYRVLRCNQEHVYITNYGIVIAYMNGILERSVRIFPEFQK